MKETLKHLWPGLLVGLLVSGIGLLLVPQLPEQMVTHWNAQGEADGWSPRLMGVLLLPGIMLVVAVTLVVAPKLDPKRANFTQHAGAYWVIANAVLVFMAGVQGVVLLTNLGHTLDINRLISGGVGLLFVVLGNLLSRVRPNWILGIRTPWTLSSERSWRETHRIGGYTFVLGGLVLIAMGFLSPSWFMPGLIVVITLTAVVPVVWSYIVWKQDTDSTSGGTR